MSEVKWCQESGSAKWIVPSFSFEQKRKAKKNNAALMVDQKKKTFEYSFVKRKPKTKAEMLGKLFARDLAAAVNSTETIVTVIANLDDIKCVHYNEAQNTMMVVGKFSVMYLNTETGEEVVREYVEEGSCFSFQFEFENVSLFMRMFKDKNALTSYNHPLIPVSL